MWRRPPGAGSRTSVLAAPPHRPPSLPSEEMSCREGVFSLSPSIWLHVAGGELCVLQLEAAGSRDNSSCSSAR